MKETLKCHNSRSTQFWKGKMHAFALIREDFMEELFREALEGEAGLG